MPKLSRNMYTTAKGERKLNCYGVNIPKEVVNKTDLEDKKLKITAEGNKIIIEKDDSLDHLFGNVMGQVNDLVEQAKNLK